MPGRDHILEAYGIKSLFDFRKKFCRIEYKSYNPRMQAKPVVTGSKNLDELERLLKDCAVIRRKLADVVENLPPITYRTISVGFKNVEHVKLPGDPAALIRELNKPDSGLSKIRRKLGVAKASDAIEYLTETAAGPTLVGFWHIDVGAAYVEAFADTNFRIGYIDGSTPQHIREQYISEFNDNKLDFLFGQIKAMGVAANLQEAAERVALVEEVLSPAELEQFVARVYRRGQKRHVQVDLIRSNHDLDEAMLGVRLSKEATIERVI
jgi:SNF2 family DNA or RNA helicase